MIWRAIFDRARPGALNMALDEALMISQAQGWTEPTLRFYHWKPACVSLGYFQRAEAELDLEACGRRGVDVVRRPTGGRAVLHDDEVTYSVVIPQAVLPGSVIETYRVLSAGILQGLSYLGLVGEPAAGVAVRSGGLGAACFDAPSRYETLVRGRKIIGSAQTRQDGIILQHGSLLLSFDAEALVSVMRAKSEAARARLVEHMSSRVTSVGEELGRRPARREVETALACGMARALGLTLHVAGFERAEMELARRLCREKYSSPAWTHGGRRGAGTADGAGGAGSARGHRSLRRS